MSRSNAQSSCVSSRAFTSSGFVPIRKRLCLSFSARSCSFFCSARFKTDGRRWKRKEPLEASRDAVGADAGAGASAAIAASTVLDEP